MNTPSPASGTPTAPCTLTSTWPVDTLGRADMALRGWLVRCAAGLVGYVRDFTRDDEGRAYHEVYAAVGNWMQRTNWPVRPLRIGLVNPGDWSAPLFEAPAACETEWFSVPKAFRTGHDRIGLDAVVSSQGSGGLAVETIERHKRDAAWYDWSVERPLSFPAVFPYRTDCARLSIEQFAGADATIARRLVEAAAISSRHPCRLTFADHTRGRCPAGQPHQRAKVRTPRPYLPNHDAATATLRTLARTVHDEHARRGSSGLTPARRTAARLAGAWLATTPGLDDESRRAWMESVAAQIGEEPTTTLRLAAVRIGTLDDEAGFDALLRADRMLRDTDTLSPSDHAAFLDTELEHGCSTPMTIGRLAAGLCLAGATLPVGQLTHFFEDLLDDMRFASLLIGRDHDRALLTQVCRAIEKGRHTGTFSLPAAAAAKKPARRRRAA